MTTPPYYKQEYPYACSLAVLRMVLAAHSHYVAEQVLMDKIAPTYGTSFKNIWNPTIAKLARLYHIPVLIQAKWQLCKPEKIMEAIQEYEQDPHHFDYQKFERSSTVSDKFEPLPLAYQDMFAAFKMGSGVAYGGLTQHKIMSALNQGKLLQTSLKLHKLYPGRKHAFHSILLYGYQGDLVYYHDPADLPAQTVPFSHLLKAASNVGAFMVYG